MKSILPVLLVLMSGFSILNCSSEEELKYGGKCADLDEDGNFTANDGKGAMVTVLSASGHIHSYPGIISAQDIVAIAEKYDPQLSISATYSLNSVDGHTHDFTLTGLRFWDLRSNRGISVKSTVVNGHNHEVVINCAP